MWVQVCVRSKAGFSLVVGCAAVETKRREYPFRVAQAHSAGQLAWDVLQLVAPDEYSPILRLPVDSFSPNEAVEGMHLFNVLTDTSASPMALPSTLRRAGVSERAPRLFHTVGKVLRPSPQKVGRSMFLRPVCAHPLARSSVLHGLKFAYRPRGGVGARHGRFAYMVARAVRELVLSCVAQWPRVSGVRLHVVQVEPRAGCA